MYFNPFLILLRPLWFCGPASYSKGQKAAQPVVRSGLVTVSGDCLAAETDEFDTMRPAVFVRNQGIMIGDMTEASVFKTDEKILGTTWWLASE